MVTSPGKGVLAPRGMAAAVFALAAAASATGADATETTPAAAPVVGACAVQEATVSREAWWAAVDHGLVPDPRTQERPTLAPPAPEGPGPVSQCLAPEQIFIFEDTGQLLMDLYSPPELYALMVGAANRVVAKYGDDFDFIGFFTNFDPVLLFGTAFYLPIRNDVTGIGHAGAAIGEDTVFDRHEMLGLGGERLQGMFHFWNVNAGYWQPGDGAEAATTRLLLAHEIEHRFGVFLPPLPGDRPLQGDNQECGRAHHWSQRVDGQGSGMELSEWVGSDPATRVDATILFNGDTGGTYSFLDLYLMGYVTASEVDAGMSELRYMDDGCVSPYSGAIADVTAADLVEVVGPRVPDALAAQKHFRTAWVMIHQPGDPPDAADLAKATGILEQHVVDFHFSTQRRGTMSHAAFADCNCNGQPDADEIAGGLAEDRDGNGIPDACEALPCPGDLDGSGDVDIGDMVVLLTSWGPCPAPPETCPSDLNGSGVVNFGDALVLLSYWGPCP